MLQGMGNYVILETIGSGSTGTVYLAQQTSLDRLVALKHLAPRLASEPGFLDRFRQEAHVMTLLDHPNCVKVWDFFEADGTAFLASEYIEGASLRAVISAAGKLSPEQALGVVEGALLGLDHAHSLGLTHRDLKPENILADQAGLSKLADFGQAVFAADANQGPAAAVDLGSSGTPHYLSPEQAQGQPVDVRSDVYSAGVLLFELLTGRRPFTADNPLALARMHIHDPVPSARGVDGRLSEGISEVVARAMAKAPADRFQSAGEFLTALRQQAEDDHGAGWHERTSISGVVGSAAAAALAAGGTGTVAAGGTGTVAAGAAATGSGAGLDVSAATGAAPATTPAALPTAAAAAPTVPAPGLGVFRRLLRPQVLAVAGAALVGLVAVTAVVATRTKPLGSTRPTAGSGPASGAVAPRRGAAGPAGVFTEYSIPTPGSGVTSIAAGRDGNLWFTEALAHKIGRVTTAGVFTEFMVPTATSEADQITAGPDGNLWLVEHDPSRVARVTPTGLFTEFALAADRTPRSIGAGADGNLWFTLLGNRVARITTAGTVTEYVNPVPNMDTGFLTAGPDGNVWITETGHGSAVARVTPQGIFTEFSLPVPQDNPEGINPQRITRGRDGGLWLTEQGDSVGRVSRLTTAGVFTDYPTPKSRPDGIAAGPDGNLWFTEEIGNSVFRMTPSGVFSEYAVPTVGSGPGDMVAGPDGNLWFIETKANKVAKVTAGGG